LATPCSHTQNYAVQQARLASLRVPAGLYPLPAAAMAAAGLLDAGDSAAPSIEALIDAAEQAGNRQAWTHTAPPNVLLLPVGQHAGTVADVMGAEELNNSAIVLTLDVVHSPHTVSEFQHHSDQSLDDAAHYHFLTPPGMALDAASFLRPLSAEQPVVLPGGWLVAWLVGWLATDASVLPGRRVTCMACFSPAAHPHPRHLLLLLQTCTSLPRDLT
jgi:hypothetical protein